MSKEYYLERNRNTLKKLNEILNFLPDFCSVYFIGISATTSPLTRLNYATDLRTFFDYLVNNERCYKGKRVKDLTIQDLDSITAFMIEGFLNYSLMYKNKYGTIRTNAERGQSRKLSSIRSMLEFFFNKDLIKSNVGTKVKNPKLKAKPIIHLEKEEISELLDVTESLNGFSEHQKKYNEKFKVRDNAIITLFLGTGIRVSECVGLNVEDIDFQNNAFKVIRKGGGQSILYFNEEVKNSLLQYLKYRENLDIDQNERALFISMKNRRMSVRAMENLVHKYTRITTPLKNISPHKLRSTFGTNLYRESRDIYMVANILGHKDINTTQKHYADISDEIKKEAVDFINLKQHKESSN